MPAPTPFHARTAPLCRSQEWRTWAGYLAVSTYEPSHEYEYYAIRNSAALIDVSPLFKYEISGPQATAAVNRILTRDATKCAVGQVLYSPWCDDNGRVIDDGTISRLESERYRLTAADPNLAWFQDCCLGLEAQVTDISAQLAALAVQGPGARRILGAAFPEVSLDHLKYYRLAQASFAGMPLAITRTGYTGDLGYELWIPSDGALQLWDRVWETGRDYGLAPAGMLALDIARVEAGLLLIEVDYKPARKTLIRAQESTPYELGLGWAVDLSKAAFVGRKALLAEQRSGSRWAFVGLEIEWDSLEALYQAVDLAPQLAGRASRSPVPVYKNNRQIGQVTSHTFSPILKKYIALGTLEQRHAAPGTKVDVEFTIEYVHRHARATVVKLPFFNPSRKRD